MKTLMPSICLTIGVTVMPLSFAQYSAVENYRLGHYVEAARQLEAMPIKDALTHYYLAMMRLYGYGELRNNTLAIQQFRQAAEKGYVPAQNIMARYELIEKNNPVEALHWFKKSAAAGDTAAQMYCAAAYLFGYGTKKNPSQARGYYIDAAKNNNSLAQFTLADYFLTSRHAKDQRLGMIWLQKAVEQGNPQAQLKLGLLYAEGKHVEKNNSNALAYIDLAIKQGYLPALIARGDMALNAKQFNQAKQWYLKAANQQYAPAQMALASLYLQKESPFYHEHTGFLWVLKAAQQHYQPAQKRLSQFYSEGAIVDKNEHLAKAWSEKASDNKEAAIEAKREVLAWLTAGKAINFAQSSYQLGGIFSTWHNSQALQENHYNPAPQMQPITGQMLYQPQFKLVEPNTIPISELYEALADYVGNQSTVLPLPHYSLTALRQAAKNTLPANDKAGHSSTDSLYDKLYGQAILGNATAQFKLGQMYQYGIGVEQNGEKAIEYYQLAASQNELRAEYNLGLLYLEGKSTKPDYQQALSWLENAAFKGNAYAQFALAQLYEHGFKEASGEEAIKANKEEALAMYHLAAANHYGLAQYRLAHLLAVEHQGEMNVQAKEQRNALIKSLYQQAVDGGVKEARLPLAFFNAMDKERSKQEASFAVALQAAKGGNKEAALLVGLLFDRGIGITADSAQALHWYQLAEPNPIAAYILGTYYSKGQYLSEDKQKGRLLLQQAADAHFSYALLNLAIIKQQEGESFLTDLEKARTKGNSKAGLLLADYYLSQGDDASHLKKARDIYQFFADKGDKDAQLKLGFMFEQGLGGAVAIEEAAQWYKAAAKQGQPFAQYLLGRLYQLGVLNKQLDEKKAIYWYGKAQTHFPPAAVALGFVLDTVKTDYQQAEAAYKVGVHQQNTVAFYNLGLIYLNGKGQAVDTKKAFSLLNHAAEKGHAAAMVQVAQLYFNGIDGQRDEQNALVWYKKAAALGNSEALYQLGLFSETGTLLPANTTQALHYYHQSAAKNNAKAILALARIYQYGQGIAKDTKQAINWYTKLADIGNPYALYQLACLYQEGDNGQQTRESMQLLKQAERHGSLQARKVLQWLDAQSQERLSYIEPIHFVTPQPTISTQEANVMYLYAINEWNQGDELSSARLLDDICTQFPDFMPAKQAYKLLQQTRLPRVFIS